MPKFSVITVCKNAANDLEQTIESVLRQSFNDFEYILIDGASTDSSPSIIKKYAARINIIISEPDRGVYDAMNKAIKSATGEYLIFINAGDKLNGIDCLQKSAKLIQSEGLIYSDALVEFSSGIKMIKYVPPKIDIQFMLYDTIPHQCSFIRRDLFVAAGLYDDKLKISADYKFYLKSLFELKTTYKKLPFILSRVNYSGLNSSKDNLAIREKERLDAFKEIVGENVASNISKSKLQILIKKYPSYALGFLKALFLGRES